MSMRAYRVGDMVCIRPDAVAALTKEGYIGIVAHEPTKIKMHWFVADDRRVLMLDLRKDICVRGEAFECNVRVWPSQVRLANGTAERASVATEARVARMVADKAMRETGRRRPKARRAK